MTMIHLVASISAHGHGHMAITAPVLERLHGLDNGWRFTVSSGLPEEVLRARIRCPFEARSDALDFGLRMRPDLTVDVEQTVADYRAIHEAWERRVDERAGWLRRSGCDLLLSNISYLNLAAAARAGIPAIALSPLNWADLYRHFAPDTPDTRSVFEQMVDAYNDACAYLSPEPCMPAPHFGGIEVIPPVVQTGRDHRQRIHETFGLDDGTRLLLLALGGQQADLGRDELPVIPGACWLADRRYGIERDDVLTLEQAGLAFPDLLASSDLLVCKPGYGAFAEAACLARPVVYIRRPHWPEEPYLIDWLRRHVPCREAPRADAGALGAAVEAVLAEPPGPGCAPDGVEQCVRRLRQAVN